MSVKKILCLVFLFTLVNTAFAGWFKLGSPSDNPVKFEMGASYSPLGAYWSTTEKKAIEADDYPKNYGYGYNFKLTLYLTRLLYVNVRVPIKGKRKARFKLDDETNEDYTEGEGPANFEFGFTWAFFDSKGYKLLWNCIKKINWGFTYIYDNGSDLDVVEGPSLGKNVIRNKFKADILFIPARVNPKLHKNLYLSPDVSFTYEGRYRTKAIKYSSSGAKPGNSIDTTIKLYYVVNKYIKTELFYKPYITFKEKNADGVKDDESFYSEHGLGMGARWRLFGRTAVELAYKVEWPLHSVTQYRDSKESVRHDWILKFAF